MSNQQQRETVEDTPRYQSVMMAPSMAPPMPRSFAVPEKRQMHQPLSSEKPTISAAVWSVSELHALPAEHMLERTNVYVDSNCQEVADRICDCLRLESIAASCDKEDKCLLEAETSDCVKFNVRLFKDNGHVVVEVQRKCGCSFAFREAAKSVLRSAKGIKAAAPKRRFTIPGCLPVESMEQKQKRLEDGLQVAFNMIRSDRLDTQLLGMESLEQITGSCECKAFTAKAILGGKCLEKLISSAESDGSEPVTEMEERHFFVMKRRALGILANALSALAESNELGSLLSATPDLRSDSLLASLVSTLKEASDQTHEASQAARCMQYLLIDREVEQLLANLGIISVVSSACRVGSTRSSLLERETKKLKMQLDKCC